MFNNGRKKEALRELERSNNRYKNQYSSTIESIELFHNNKVASASILDRLTIQIENSFGNRLPQDLRQDVEEIKIAVMNFNREIEEIKKLDEKNVGGKVAAAGVAAGVGTAALGPSAAMAIATTFGTASTGAAIGTLSGAAATNAALAWLGGGALAAGGGGMAAGEALLALAGPVGWAIGGAALLGGGLLANSKNKEIARKAESQTREIMTEINKLEKVESKVDSQNSLLVKGANLVQDALNEKLDFLNYNQTISRLSSAERDELKAVINEAKAVGKIMTAKIA